MRTIKLVMITDEKEKDLHVKHVEWTNGCNLSYKLKIKVGNRIYGDTDLCTVEITGFPDNYYVYSYGRYFERLEMRGQ